MAQEPNSKISEHMPKTEVVAKAQRRQSTAEYPCSAHGKRYSLVTLVVIIFLTKLVGKDRPLEIADWAKSHAEELAPLLHLKRSWMPHHNTIRPVSQCILSVDEFDRLAQE